MILYHGSDIVVNAPQLVIQNRMLDFGPGFYTTTNLDQAINFAGKVMVRRNSPLGYVSFYELDLPEAEKELDILTFNIADEFWLDLSCKIELAPIAVSSMMPSLVQWLMMMFFVPWRYMKQVY